ncbi:MAG: V-type ATP synthase subunit D [Bacteroidales bacterium]|nr:V-type ATP synthase subunit D [Bacteroidales bacterium]
MAVKFQYNKTSLNEIGKQLKVRQKALPTLQNKESALRLEVRKAKNESDRLIADLEAAMDRYDYLASLWNEFDPGLVAITDVDLHTVKVAGVKTPGLGEIHYEIRPFNAFVKPAWYADGVAILKELSRLGIESEVYQEKARILDYQRKKTTQKVNLYEKVQIPGYQEAIRKIKRYMEDEENLSKASQKIVKQRHAAEEEEASEV